MNSSCTSATKTSNLSAVQHECVREAQDFESMSMENQRLIPPHLREPIVKPRILVSGNLPRLLVVLLLSELLHVILQFWA